MLGGERFYPVNGENELEVNWLLGPERPVVIKGGYTLLWPNEIRRTFLCYIFHKCDDGFLRRGVVPGRDRVRLSEPACAPDDRSDYDCRQQRCALLEELHMLGIAWYR